MEENRAGSCSFIVIGVICIVLVFFVLARAIAGAQQYDGQYNPVECEAYYGELTRELAGMQDWHRRWADYLEANPGEVAHIHIVSAEVQRFWVQQYDYRLWALWWAVYGGDRTWIPWLIDHLRWSQGLHVGLRDRLLAEPWQPLNQTVDGVAGQQQMINLYDWRLNLVQRILDTC